jgi:hypothetical protein
MDPAVARATVQKAINVLKESGYLDQSEYPGENETMPTAEIETFAELVVRHVRDAAIRSCDTNLRPDVTQVVAKRWKTAGRDLDSIAKVLIPDIVDETIFRLLHAIDEGLLPLAHADSTGTVVNLTKEGLGELAGWYMGSRGWRAQYSDQRFVDDFADLVGE